MRYFQPSNYSDSDTGTYDSRKSAEKPPKIEDAKGSQEKWADSQTDSQPATTPDSAKVCGYILTIFLYENLPIFCNIFEK